MTGNIHELNPRQVTARDFYLESENDLLQIERLAVAIQSLATVVGGAPDEAHYGIAVEIEKRVKAIRDRGEETPRRA
jgi:hypothetical protein